MWKTKRGRGGGGGRETKKKAKRQSGNNKAEKEKAGRNAAKEIDPITKSLLTTFFLHTAVGVSRVIQCSKAKSELIGWRRNF